MSNLDQLKHFRGLELVDESQPALQKFGQALSLLINGCEKEAADLLIELLPGLQQEELIDATTKLIFDALFSHGRYETLNELGLLESERIERDNRLIAKVIIGFAERELTFTQDQEILPITFSSTGQPMIEILIHGMRKLFWLDTGAGMTVLSASLAEVINLELSAIGVEIGASTNVSVQSRLTCIGQLEIGNVRITNQPALVLSDDLLTLTDPVTQIKTVIDGIIGWDIIRDLFLAINYKKAKLTLKKSNFKEQKEPTLIFSGYPIVKLSSYSGEPLFFGLDTGAQYTHFGKSLNLKVDQLATKTVTRFVGGIGGYKEVEVDLLESLEVVLAGIPLVYNQIRQVLVEYATFFELDGVLGSDGFQNGCLILDYPNRFIKFELIN